MNPPERTSMASPMTESSQPSNNGLRKVVAASMAGTVAEWYEFLLYSAASALVFGTLFFPKTDNALDGVLSALLIYAVGFLARPLGGVVFGLYGDKFGRKKLLQFSLLLVGISTFGMGCLPGFGSIGYWAPGLLVILRFIQGFAVGGEWGGAVLLVSEHSSDRRRGFWASWPQAGLPLGNLVATMVLSVLAFVMPESAFLGWGWRLAFWLSAVIIIIGYYIRTHVDDAPIFLESLKAEEQRSENRSSVSQAIRQYPRQIAIAMGLRVGENILYQVVVTFSITYLAFKVGMKIENVLLVMLIPHLLHFILIPVIGGLTDRIGRKPIYMTGALLMVLWAFTSYPLMNTGNIVLVIVALTLGLAVHALVYAPQAAMMSEMFPTRIRYSGVSLGYQVTSVFAGSVAPFIATYLLREYHSWIPIAIYLVVAASVSLVAISAARETCGISLQDVDAQDRTRFPPSSNQQR
ncbi:MHS family MFS transporter [Rhodococcus sp. IEGM 248]|uniref:MFS transporter n=2 Tax=Rhodococcus TaxID=1827 RepID=UPI0010629566|nr:MHS family MFS transporter [Rhodococcus sp. IEGM 248]QSE86690.1 MHS family MFS transporter [Rhodococcus koreensis]